MSATSKSWYVQGGFGTLLGPMPEDALVQMAQTGALLPDDLIREAASMEWLSACDIAGLLDPSVAYAALSEQAFDSVSVTESALPQTANSTVDEPRVSDPILSVDLDRFAPPEDVPPIEVAENEMVIADPIVSPEFAPPVIETSAGKVATLSGSPSLSPVAPRYSGPTPRFPQSDSLASKLKDSLQTLPSRLTSPFVLRSVAVVVVLLIGWLFFPARSQPPQPAVRLADVEGIVLLNEKLLPNVLVVFKPDKRRGSIGPSAVGRTDAEGRFTLKSGGTRRGAVVGKHQIMVLVKGYDPNTSDSAPNLSGGQSGSSVPNRYSRPETTPLVAEVLPEQTNQVSLSLTSN